MIPSLVEEGIEVRETIAPEFSEFLTADALRFVAKISRQFSRQRELLLRRRAERQIEIDHGKLPSFLSETKHIRNSSWAIASVPSELHDRRVEITGPAGDTKMVINALNSGANVYMADFEDAQSPTWENTLRGQLNLRNVIRGTIQYISPDGKNYQLNKKVAVLMMRPRGWHLHEKHVYVDGIPISASLFDFGIFFYHNTFDLLRKGTQPYFYLPKIENHFEARLWNDVFTFSENELGNARGTIKATVLIETILAAFEMDEILYELREHSAGLNCGRWDYIFSFIKKFHKYRSFVLSDRSSITMDKGFLASYVKLLIQTCHKRGAHAMGGMAAQIPVKNNDGANTMAFHKVRADKEREVHEGHDGTWVAHPGMVSVAKEVFDERMEGSNQVHIQRENVVISANDLLAVPEGPVTEQGLRTNIDVGIQYLEAWLRGAGAVPLYNLMEDAATAEISRAQVWQWIHHNISTVEGKHITVESVRQTIREELENIRTMVGDLRFREGRFELAATLFDRIVTQEEFVEFLTLPAYEYL
ncbi:MAG: malate synthase A [Ignavibacteria bacterium]|nr:malate synthase A [Ignavibacteria bacterium]